MKLVILTLVVAFAVAGVPDSRAGGVSEHRNASCEALGLHEGMNLDLAAQDHNKHRAAEALEESRIALEDLQKLYAHPSCR